MLRNSCFCLSVRSVLGAEGASVKLKPFVIRGAVPLTIS